MPRTKSGGWAPEGVEDAQRAARVKVEEEAAKVLDQVIDRMCSGGCNAYRLLLALNAAGFRVVKGKEVARG